MTRQSTLISVESIDGYVSLCGGANLKPDGAKWNTWQPHATETASVGDMVLNPDIGRTPLEFVDIDLAARESELESVLYTTDDWIHADQPDMMDWAISESPKRRQKDAHDWRGACALPLRDALGVRVLYDLLLWGKPFDMSAM